MFDILGFSEFSELAEELLESFSIAFGFSGIIGLVLFVLQGIGLYKMGKALGVSAPWLSFIPVVSVFALGRIAGKYIKRDGKNSAKFGVWLLILEILVYILLIVLIACLIIAAISVFGYATNAITEETSMTLEMFSAFIPVIILYVVLLGIAIAYRIVYFVALWRAFSIFSSGNATLFTVLSIFFTFLAPIFLFVVRNGRPTLTYAERLGFEQL